MATLENSKMKPKQRKARKASRYMMKKFCNDFDEICEFWTGEDGYG